jgi:guanine nucleotide-binding protein alpha-1 subunit
MITTPRPPSVRSLGIDFSDPFNAILRPPEGESDSDRQLRLQREAEAKRISDSIDEELRQEERRFRKRKEDVKVCVQSPGLALLQGPSAFAWVHSYTLQ